MADELRARYDGIEVDLIKGSGGAFEVRHQDKLIFSKHRAGRFPNDEEVFEALDNFGPDAG